MKLKNLNMIISNLKTRQFVLTEKTYGLMFLKIRIIYGKMFKMENMSSKKNLYDNLFYSRLILSF